MKKLWILAAVVVFVALFSTCSLNSKTSISQCISNFMSDINGNQANVYTNLDPTSAMYSLVKSAAYWNLLFPCGYTYTLTNENIAGSTVTGTLTSNYSLYSSGVSISFTMSTDGSGNAVIHSITLGGSSTIYQ
jgi:hypothetical protein